ncbi:MAG: hemolysin family protein [Verrucomicrobiota bacterium]|nr:hemolysin family protein [Verrucomicrobiota bacterium]
MEFTWRLATVVVIIGSCLSFFFALAESSLFSLGKYKTQELASSANRGARLFQLLARQEDVLATISFGNTLANASIVAAVLVPTFKTGTPILLPLIIATVFILLACEILPKALALRAPEFWAFQVLAPMEWIMAFLRPIRQVAQTLNNGIIRLVVPASIKPQPYLSDTEYEELLDMAYQQGALAHTEKELIARIVTLDRLTASNVMRPRGQMACISDDATIEEMVEAARKFKFSRLPIYDESPDTIVGFLDTRKLLQDPYADLGEMIEFPSFVPGSMNLLQLLKSFQKQKRGLAIVLDEFGGTAGLVTVDDILAEVIGELSADRHRQNIVLERRSQNSWRLSGNYKIEDFRRELPELPEVEEVDTFGGLLVRLLEVVPDAGQSAMYGPLKLTATAVDSRRVQELIVEKVR